MTSSLVGSEMCIRDSSSVSQSVSQSASQSVRSGQVMSGPTDPPTHTPITPVSYTHLTLPTICSV
eukprot:8959079-Prorocentrum_lima.AAC.1